MTDQLRADCLGYAGHPDVKTSYLDTLASKGVVFDRAYSACPSCIAARAALHTGREQSRHGRVGYEDGLPWNYHHTMRKSSLPPDITPSALGKCMYIRCEIISDSTM